MSTITLDRKITAVLLPAGWHQVKTEPLLQHVRPIGYRGKDTWHIAALTSTLSVEDWADILLGPNTPTGIYSQTDSRSYLEITVPHVTFTDTHYFISDGHVVAYAHARAKKPAAAHRFHLVFAQFMRDFPPTSEAS